MFSVNVTIPYRKPVSFLVHFQIKEGVHEYTVFENGIHGAILVKVRGDDAILVVNQEEVLRMALQKNQGCFVAVVFSSDSSVRMHVGDSMAQRTTSFPMFRDFCSVDESIIERFVVLREELNVIQVASFYNFGLSNSARQMFTDVVIDMHY